METCPYCSTPHYDPAVLEQSASKTKITQREFHTMPLGPQLQAIYCSWESAEQMHYGENKMDEIMKEFQAGSSGIVNYEDWCHGSDSLKAFHEKHLKKGDPILMFSIDGAQLYCNKTSNFWMDICVIFNLDPATGRYKKTAVLFGAIIPGPSKPKILESFLFPALHHLSVIQKEGLLIWDTFTDSLYISHPFLVLGTADGSAMTYINGLIGHQGRIGCCLYCPFKGHRKGSHYYPVCLKPHNSEHSDHPNQNPSDFAYNTFHDYK